MEPPTDASCQIEDRSKAAAYGATAQNCLRIIAVGWGQFNTHDAWWKGFDRAAVMGRLEEMVGLVARDSAVMLVQWICANNAERAPEGEELDRVCKPVRDAVEAKLRPLIEARFSKGLKQ